MKNKIKQKLIEVILKRNGLNADLRKQCNNWIIAQNLF